jgi:hypothetical protein
MNTQPSPMSGPAHTTTETGAGPREYGLRRVLVGELNARP